MFQVMYHVYQFAYSNFEFLFQKMWLISSHK